MQNRQYNIIIASPILFAVSFALGVVAFLLSVYYSDLWIGSPSSTSCLIFVFIPCYAFGAAFIGAVVGFLVAAIVRAFGVKQTSIIWMMIIPILTVFIGGLSGYLVVRNYVAVNSVGVKLSDSSIVKTNINFKSTLNIAPLLIGFENQQEPQSFKWNGQDIMLSFPENCITITDINKNVMIETSLKKYDYICEIQAIETRLFPVDQNCLAVLADLRATSHHCMLLVYSPQGRLIYQEMLERYSHRYLPPIAFQYKDYTDSLDRLVVENGKLFVWPALKTSLE
jgi:hypothetical protein